MAFVLLLLYCYRRFYDIAGFESIIGFLLPCVALLAGHDRFHVILPNLHHPGRKDRFLLDSDIQLARSFNFWPECQRCPPRLYVLVGFNCLTDSRIFQVCVCVLHMKPFFLPIDIQHNQCPCRFFNPREIQVLRPQNYVTERYI